MTGRCSDKLMMLHYRLITLYCRLLILYYKLMNCNTDFNIVSLDVAAPLSNVQTTA